MSKTFWIKSVGASGPGKRYSSLNFERDKVNIIYGPSNSGKSYVIECIDFMLWGDGVPFTRQNTGYDTVHMDVESSDGISLNLKRKIVNGKKGDKGDTKMEVVASTSDIRSGEYTKADYNALMLRLMGIEKAHKLIAYQDFRPEKLSLRTLCHIFYLNENVIFTDKPVIDNPKYSKPYAAMSIIYFLLTGDDLKSIMPDVSKKERDEKKIKKEAVLNYIYLKKESLRKQKEALEASLQEEDDSDLDQKMEDTVAQIAAIETEIKGLSGRSAELLKTIYDISAKLEEATFLSGRYKTLRSQYNSDIKRLKFVIEGDQYSKKKVKILTCPFCGSEMKREEETTKSYAAASRAELENVTEQLEDLKLAEKDIQNQIETLESRIADLNEENDSVVARIREKLQPRAQALKNSLEAYKRIVEVKKELAAIETLSSGLGTDALEKEAEDPGEAPLYHPDQYLINAGWQSWSDLFEKMVQACAYPGKPQARISIETHDAIVGQKFKKDEGKGYRAFLNVLVLFSLMKKLEDDGTYRPGLMVLDSPILSLKEKKENSGITEKDKADPGMRESLFQYLIDNCGTNQIIIAENEIPMTGNMNYKMAKLIKFGENGIRDGFLLDPNENAGSKIVQG